MPKTKQQSEKQKRLLADFSLENLRELCLNDLEFLAEFVLVPFEFGQDFELGPFHRQRLRETGDCIIHNVPRTLDLWFRGGFKALRLDTPVMTPKGWRSHGDLVPGDQVFGPDGKPTDVVGKSDIFVGSDCYKVTFDDGCEIFASGDHLWAVERKSAKRRPGAWRAGSESRIYREKVVLTTAEMAAHDHRADNRLSVPVNEPLQFPEATDLEIDPYVLGYWLGDGSKGTSCISVGDEDIDEFCSLMADCGVRTRRKRLKTAWRVVLGDGEKHHPGTSEIKGALRSLGVLDRKHVPAKFFMASARQRMALLQGLMDSDGTVKGRPGGKSARGIFSSKSLTLAQNVWDLATSLGMKPSLKTYVNKMHCGDYEHHRVTFSTNRDNPPFRLRRKAEKCGSAKRWGRRYVVGVERVESEPTSCIKVAREDGEYLVGSHLVTTHNTTFLSRYGNLLRILRNPNLTLLIRHGEAEKAEGVVKGIKTQLEANEILRMIFPEYCPPRGKRFGTQSWFDLPNRTNTAPEHTVTGVGIEANLTGGHWMHIHDDDIEHEININTAETRLKLKRKFQDTHSLLTKKPVYAGTQSCVGTVWHSDGLWTWLMDNFGPTAKCPEKSKFVVHFHPVVKGKVANGRFLPEQDGDGNWVPTAPDILNLEDIKQLAYDEGPYRFSSNYFLCPQDEDSAAFKDKWIQYKPFPQGVDLYSKGWLKECIVRRCLSVDLAVSQDRNADMLAYVIVDIDEKGQWYFREAYRNRIDALSFIKKLQEMHANWQFDQIYVDAVATQLYFSKWLKRENELEGISMPLHPVKKVDSKKTKEMRIMACQPRWARFDCYLMEGAKGTKTLVEDLMSYPGIQFDDLLDAMAQLEMMEPKGKRPRGPQMPVGCAQWWMDFQDDQKSKRKTKPGIGNWRTNPRVAPSIQAVRRTYGKRRA